MTTPTTRPPAPPAPPTPTSAPRVGPGGAALPNDPGLDALLADPGLGSTAKAIACALVRNWAWYKPSCFPSDRTIALKVGKSPGHVQRSLRALEGAGYIRREATPEVRSGRRIWLLWRDPDGGQGPDARVRSTAARGPGSAPARSEQVVVEQERGEQDIRCAPQRPRLEPPTTAPAGPMARVLDQALGGIARALGARPAAPPIPDGPRPPAPRPAPVSPPRAAAKPNPPAPAIAPDPVPAPASARPAPDRDQRDQVDRMAPPASASASTIAPAPAPRESPRPVPADTPPAPPLPTPATIVGTPLAALTAPEQARYWELSKALQRRVLTWLSLDDRICAAEVRRLLAPPPPPVPRPHSLSTRDLLAGLPGRPQHLAAAAGRLAAELRDPKSFNYYHTVAEAVCTGQQPASALLSAWRQGTSPKAKKPGAVFAVAWRRETAPD